MKKLQNSEIFRYVMTGGMTTVINYIIYILLTALSIDYLVANSIAWLGAVIFAYYANRHMVFHSEGDKRQEFMQFFGLRLATLVVENLLLYLFVGYVGAAELPSKVMVSIITVILNYFACKYSIFKEGGVSRE
ncbi:GtrA-like protein [uncultured Eubacterium sp.]|nr:GtrA-like protein [uncultured Eubacterium sp.]